MHPLQLQPHHRLGHGSSLSLLPALAARERLVLLRAHRPDFGKFGGELSEAQTFVVGGMSGFRDGIDVPKRLYESQKFEIRLHQGYQRCRT
jgi:hypothetical protein